MFVRWGRVIRKSRFNKVKDIDEEFYQYTISTRKVYYFDELTLPVLQGHNSAK